MKLKQLNTEFEYLPQNDKFLDSFSFESYLISLFNIWTTTVQNFIPIYQQIWILQIFSHFSRIFSQNFGYFSSNFLPPK